MLSRLTALPLLATLLVSSAFAQVEISGRAWMPAEGNTEEMIPFTTITGFASLPGSDSQTATTRTWETYPSGWYLLSGMPGAYTVTFSNPAHFMRPVVRTNVFTVDREKVNLNVAPVFDYAVVHERTWDESAAYAYYQLFRATGTSITQVGFKLAHDGVDGEGPRDQTVLISIRRKGEGDLDRWPPDTWDAVGPTMPVLRVNCGGGLNRHFSAGWNSGEVPTVPGEIYAVKLYAHHQDSVIQPFWKEAPGTEFPCFRVSWQEKKWVDANLWMTVSSDNDGLVIPYNKRVHLEYGELAGFSTKWAQTWVAMGEGLASAILYAAVSTDQPPLVRQRAVVRVRRGGPDGPVVGIEKIAKGQSMATAEGGSFGVSYAPGEVPLVPGETYALEWESLGADGGFNPWPKQAEDDYPHGSAWYNGTEERPRDLDAQIIEYQRVPDGGWPNALTGGNRLDNGDFEDGELHSEDPASGGPRGWSRFVVDASTTFAYRESEDGSRYASVTGGGMEVRTADGGYVRKVEGLDRGETYRLTGRGRSTWAVDFQHNGRVGVDPTGQTTDPDATTIQWMLFPGLHNAWTALVTDPVRPAEGSVSVWLRAWSVRKDSSLFEVDFDDLTLRQVDSGVPR